MAHDPRPLENFSMWAAAQAAGRTFDKQNLIDLVEQWMQMATQKTAGQRKDRPKDVSFENLERVKMGILCEAVALVYSGQLDHLPSQSEKENKE